ncbi:MAG: hypothetical protein AB7I30_12595 [Isosphaeraceae bacterium]
MADSPRRGDPTPWTRADVLATLFWLVVALISRLPMMVRAEGMLDHDQSVVGLMALDVAEGRRFPLFFDGQRYMGAVEPTIAAGFVKLFGHSPSVVSLAPWLVFGLFVAGQFALWRSWRGRAYGQLAALLSVFCGPMLTVWGVVPRGGYVEALAWTLGALALYRHVTTPGRAPLGPAGQFGCGFFLALGYFLNPLSLIVYVTLALDWAFGRHGQDLRTRRAIKWNWLDTPAALLVWLAIGLAWLCLTTFCVHVDPSAVDGGTPYVTFGGRINGTTGQALGALCVVALVGFAAWWSGGLSLVLGTLAPRPFAVLGVTLALSPFVIQGLLVKAGIWEAVPSLPVWLAAPWNCWPNVRSGIDALGLLIGSDPRAVESMMIGQGVDPPEIRWPSIATGLLRISPIVATVSGLLLAGEAWRNRADWLRFAALRGDAPGGPERLGFLFLAVAAALYLLQGTSPNSSSVRYLVPVWAVLPGLLASGILGLPERWRFTAAFVLIGSWTTVQATIAADLDRIAPAHPLALELERRGIDAIVAQTPVAIVVANLTHGAVGAVEYRPYWPRLGQRYRERFQPGRPIVCVTDRRFPWAVNGQVAWSPDQDLARVLEELAARHPGKVRPLWSLDGFDVWEADLPLDAIAPVNQPKPGAAVETVVFQPTPSID